MAPVRRPAAAQKPPAGGSVNFGDDSFYFGGLGLPEGDYAMTFHTQMFQPTKRDGTPSGQPFLAVMATAYPLNGGDPHEMPLSCGRKSHESFVPSADGKGFDAVPGGSSVGMNDSTNWAIFRKSLVNCGLPAGLLSNDLSVIDGIWVHTQNVPEPEERKQLRSATGEAALQAAADNSRPKLIPTVSEILEGGKPWEGGGGIPAEGQTVAPPARTVARPVATARPAAVAARRPVAVAPQAPVEEAEGASDEDIAVAALNGCTEHLSKPANAKGCTRLALRTGCFSAISKSQGEDMASAVLETYFNSDDALNVILGQLGYKVAGGSVTVA